MPSHIDLKSQISILKVLGWAAFLGCSWTWCIGMFLPVLLVRDMGFWGWVVFAVPNVMGVGLMGALLRPGHSERMARDHLAACAAFTAVTISFHVFFLLWFVPRLVGLPSASIAFALTAGYLVLTVSRAKWDLLAAVVAFAFSLAMLGWFLSRGGLPNLRHTAGDRLNPLWLAPVCVFGFFLCPYLDLTFHRARQALNSRESWIAFGDCFGICFLPMIFFSAMYAPRLWPLLGPDWRDHVRPALGAIVAAHMIVQAAYTLAVHTRSFVAAEVNRGGVLMLIVMAQLALFLGLGANLLPRYHHLDAGEMIYRLFMAFYGLLFPAYAWLCIVPGRDGTAVVTPAKVRALVLGVAVAAPMFWMGFIENRMVWLVPGVLVVLLSRFTVARSTSADTAPT